MNKDFPSPMRRLVSSIGAAEELDAGSGADADKMFAELAVEEALKSVPEDGRPHPKVGTVVVKNGTVLTRIIRENEDAESLFCYKHGVKSMFEARRKASACPTIAQHSVCCSQRFLESQLCCSSIK